MGYEPTIDAPIPLFPAKESAKQVRHPGDMAMYEVGRREPLGSRRPMRFGGLSLDTLTGKVQWQGQLVAMSEDEIEVLHAFMQNAGRIVSSTQLALQLADQPERVEERVRSLHGTLRCAGVKCLPRRTNGLGYILWY